MKIGLALSGGGVRALVFHLGVLKRLAQESLLEEITQISSVSGGSLGTGLIYNLNSLKWPSSDHYVKNILPQVSDILQSKNLQGLLAKLSILQGKLFEPRGNLLAYCLKKAWGINSLINDVSDKPRWWINSTCYETGVNWRFSTNYIGDYLYGINEKGIQFPLQKALASSAAFPGLIGPVVYKPNWGKATKVHLWDGGVYDNLGAEVLFDIDKGFEKDIDVLMISDAGKKIEYETRGFFKSALRLTEITTNQIRALRSRIVVGHLKKNPKSGGYFPIGRSVKYILKKAKVHIDPQIIKNSLSDSEVRKASQYPTDLKKISPGDFNLILRHGYETANAVLHGFMDRPYF